MEDGTQTQHFHPFRKPPVQNPGQHRGCSGGAWATRRGPPPPLGETSETRLSPGACPHPPDFCLPCGGGEDSYCQTLGSSLGSILINFMFQKDVLHCFAFSLVRVVCSHVVLGVNDLRITTIIPKSNSCCTATAEIHKEYIIPLH